jgi:hypothetical protein
MRNGKTIWASVATIGLLIVSASSSAWAGDAKRKSSKAVSRKEVMAKLFKAASKMKKDNALKSTRSMVRAKATAVKRPTSMPVDRMGSVSISVGGGIQVNEQTVAMAANPGNLAVGVGGAGVSVTVGGGNIGVTVGGGN